MNIDSFFSGDTELTKFSILTAASFMALTACGGTSTPLSFAEIDKEGLALSREIFETTYTDPSTLPTTGHAVYDGYMAATIADQYTVAGDLEMRANFANGGSFSGSVTNIVGEDESAYNGQLTLSNGAIDSGANPDTEWTYGMDMTGTLSGDQGSVVVNAGLLGDFSGTKHEYVDGAVVGSVEIDGQVQQITDGGFVGEIR